MYVTELLTDRKPDVRIESLTVGEYKLITKRRFFFDWKKEREHEIETNHDLRISESKFVKKLQLNPPNKKRPDHSGRSLAVVVS